MNVLMIFCLITVVVFFAAILNLEMNKPKTASSRPASRYRTTLG